jgi:DNA-binding response OmpR family regulator
MDPMILVVDDEPALAWVLAHALEVAGFRVRSAGTASEAMSTALVEPPDLIVLDLGLPGLGGEAVCSLLHAEPMLDKIPVVLMSGGEPEQLEKAAERCRAVEVLAKPFEIDHLVRIAQMWTGVPQA